MGLLNSLKGSRIYLDSNIWIYFLSGLNEYSQSLTDLFTAADSGSLMLITSELTIAEILVRPIREENAARREVCLAAMTNTDSSTAVPVDRSILISAAEIRASTKLKLPDAIHAATAIATECTTFLTNDSQFQTLPRLNVTLLSKVLEEPDSG